MVYNNRDGEDAKLLKQFGEPSWNNPVVRYVDAKGSDLIPRKDRVWTTTGVAEQMIKTLEAADREIPLYLKSLVAGQETKTATFAMHCYWEGESRIGSIDGVVGTRSGWLEGLEVVTVSYQPDAVAYETLVKTAQSFECASKVFAHDRQQLQVAKTMVGNQAVPFPSGKTVRDAKLSDQKYYLAKTDLIHLPLTEFQATKLNAGIRSGNSKSELFKMISPRQQALYNDVVRIKKTHAKALSELHYPVEPDELIDYDEKIRSLVTRFQRK